MKKILSLILALIFICCFGACQNNPPTPDDPSPDPHNTPQVQAASHRAGQTRLVNSGILPAAEAVFGHSFAQ